MFQEVAVLTVNQVVAGSAQQGEPQKRNAYAFLFLCFLLGSTETLQRLSRDRLELDERRSARSAR